LSWSLVWATCDWLRIFNPCPRLAGFDEKGGREATARKGEEQPTESGQVTEHYGDLDGRESHEKQRNIIGPFYEVSHD
jgi:hypothetical protein